jgi:myo-inositol 2-dehydrogenase/D-chiro-inositol 1-dehydrogenase
VRVGVVGTGGVAQRHLGVLRSIPDLEVVGHVSHTPARAAAQAVQWGGQPFTTVLELLDRQRPDAVWVCVTPDGHGLTERELIQRGIPFFVEKPLSVDLATAEHVASWLAPAGPVVAVGYKLRALDTLDHARERLAEHPARRLHALWHDALPPPAWWRHAAQSGGQVAEQATHVLDLARHLVGEAEVIAALGGQWPRVDAPDSDVPDVSSALLQFQTSQGPIPGLLSATSLLRGHQATELQLVCEGRVVRLSERALVVETGRETDELLTTVDPFLVEDLAFLAAVRTTDPGRVLCSYADALETQRLACRVRDALAAAARPEQLNRFR